jgi:hypothetical protein
MSNNLLCFLRLVVCGVLVFSLTYCATDYRYQRPRSYTGYYVTSYKTRYIPPWRHQNIKRPFYPGYYYNAGTRRPYPYIYNHYYWPRFYYRRTTGFYPYYNDKRGFRYYYD